jgi:type IV pilus assembly protein PilC
MPYFKWQGINIAGLICRGTTFARSAITLNTILDRKQIALLSYKNVTRFSLTPSISLKQKIALFEQLHTLIDAGILVPQALTIISDQLSSNPLQNKIHAIIAYIEDGHTLSTALTTHKNVFDSITIQLIKAGEESGNLAQALQAVCYHMRSSWEFKQKLRSALIVPAMTLLFFIAVMLLIFVVILPRFVHLFSMMHKELPPLTQKLLTISHFLKHQLLLLIVLCTGAVTIIAWYVQKNSQLKRWYSYAVLLLPFIGTCVRYRFLTHFFRSFSLLLQGGHKVVPALHIIESTLNNQYLKTTVNTIAQHVTMGTSVSTAMSEFEWLFDHDLVAMVHIGQESGRLAPMCSYNAQISQERLSQKLQTITVLLQPLLMLFLGLCVTILIVAIYGPICNMADIVM